MGTTVGASGLDLPAFPWPPSPAALYCVIMGRWLRSSCKPAKGGAVCCCGRYTRASPAADIANRWKMNKESGSRSHLLQPDQRPTTARAAWGAGWPCAVTAYVRDHHSFVHLSTAWARSSCNRLHRGECKSRHQPIHCGLGDAAKIGTPCCPCYLELISQTRPLIPCPDTYVTTSCISFFFFFNNHWLLSSSPAALAWVRCPPYSALPSRGPSYSYCPYAIDISIMN
jgi:hypothetical protein